MSSQLIRSILNGLLFSCMLAAGCAQPADPAAWRTRAEQTGFTHTATYDETVEYCRRLAQHSPWVRVLSIGTTPQGRDMPLVVLSRDQAFTPAAAARVGKPVVLISNGIHSGEIEGKDACLALMRDIAITRERAALLDQVTLLVLPIFNIDGHERVSEFNRINQNGPQNMGWRCTAQYLNLNRDFMKADAPEMQAWLRMFHAWKPDLFFDTHTTDGADFQYDVTFFVPSGPETARPVAEWSRRLENHLLTILPADGHKPQVYFEMLDRVNPAAGIVAGEFSPRFSTGYGAITNRPSILVETHMLKPFDVRLKATYSLLVRTLEFIAAEPQALRSAVVESDNWARRLSSQTAPENRIVLATSQPTHREGEPILFKGFEHQMVRCEAANSELPRWDNAKPVDTPSRLMRPNEIVRTSPVPRAYLIPREWSTAADRLTLHGVFVQVLPEAVTMEVHSARFHDVKFAVRPFEGRFMAAFDVEPLTESRTYPAGSFLVRLDSPNAPVAVHLLDPLAPDALVRWGFFTPIFEQKEYFEDYVMGPMADRMLAEEPALRTEFDAWLKANPDKVANPRARLAFFYERSPYWDMKKEVYPIAWIPPRVPIPPSITKLLLVPNPN
ncbi:Zinc carboxypeptidase [Phycisphaerae bacterium RAS2]|nr:Zinc carboxypeptidase [Phycisphaerae bacterium RAS2]